MTKFYQLISALGIVFLTMTPVQADQKLVYAGFGKKSTKSGENQTAPWSFGMINMRENGTNFGFDIAGEGTVLDSTWGQTNAPSQAMSINVTFGRNLFKSGNARFDLGMLVGMRETQKECPRSYVGWQCYADREPSTSYGANYGVVATYSVGSVALGARATTESVQAMIGFAF